MSFKHPANTDALKRNTNQLWFIFLSRMWLLFDVTCLLHSVSYLWHISSPYHIGCTSLLCFLSRCWGNSEANRTTFPWSSAIRWWHVGMVTSSRGNRERAPADCVKKMWKYEVFFYLCRTLKNENIYFDLPFNYM